MEQQNGELAKAFARAYADVQNVVKNKENPHFKSNYADLGAVLDTVKDTFAKHELAVYQAPGRLADLGGGKFAVTVASILMHSSGQMLSIETQVPLGDKFTAQAAGGAITYARRYALAAIAGIAQVDDDGNEASGTTERPRRGKSYAAEVASLTEAIQGFTGTVAELETQFAGAVQDLNDEAVATVYRTKRRELKAAKK
jgi:hypothetical protein